MQLQIGEQLTAHAPTQRRTEHHQERAAAAREQHHAEIECGKQPERPAHFVPHHGLHEMSSGDRLHDLLDGIGQQDRARRLASFEHDHGAHEAGVAAHITQAERERRGGQRGDCRQGDEVGALIHGGRDPAQRPPLTSSRLPVI